MDSAAPRPESTMPLQQQRPTREDEPSRDHQTLLMWATGLAILVAVVALWFAFDARSDVEDATELRDLQAEQVGEDLQAETAEANEALSSLQQATDDAAAQNARLSTDVAELRSDVQANTTSVSQLSSRVKAVEQDVATVQQDIRELDARVHAVEEGVAEGQQPEVELGASAPPEQPEPDAEVAAP